MSTITNKESIQYFDTSTNYKDVQKIVAAYTGEVCNNLNSNPQGKAELIMLSKLASRNEIQESTESHKTKYPSNDNLNRIYSRRLKYKNPINNSENFTRKSRFERENYFSFIDSSWKEEKDHFSYTIYESTSYNERKDVKRELEDYITSANKILQLEDGWDGENAAKIESEVFKITTEFLRKYFYNLFDNYSCKIQLPEINPCYNGSIDLEWHTTQAQLLVNLREVEKKEFIAFFYGDKYSNNNQIKGSVPVNDFSESLCVWMKFLT